MPSASTAALFLILLLGCACRDKVAEVTQGAGNAACLPGHFRHAGTCFPDTDRCTSDGECTAQYGNGCDTTRGRCRGWDTCGCASNADCPAHSQCITNQAVCGMCSSIPPACSMDAGCASNLLCIHGTCTQPCSQDCACRTDKMTFTRDTGCQNDGSVEFCLPSGDSDLLDWVHALAPTVQCAPGGGRAGCNALTQLLCSFPTGQAECLATHGGLVDDAWGELCQLASLPAVTNIVPTWLE